MKSKLKQYLTENILDGVSKMREMDTMPTDNTQPDWDAEPQSTEIGTDKGSEDIHVKQEKLQQLLDKKDVILMQYKSGQMSLDQYKEAIGNLPQEIKNLRDQIIAATSDEDEMTADDHIG